MSDKLEDERLTRETNTFDGKCRNCFYSLPAVNEDLVWCGIVSASLKEREDMGMQKYLAEVFDFKGLVYEGYFDRDTDSEEPELAFLMDEVSTCKKFREGE